MEASILAGIVTLAIGILYPFTDFYNKRKIKKQWLNLMKEKKISNSLNETFKITKIKDLDDKTISVNVKIPTGLTLENLEPLKRNIEYTLNGDACIKWDKYSGIINILINKDNKNKLSKIKSDWSDIMLERDIKNKFGESFRVNSVSEVDKNKYQLHIGIPTGKTYKDLDLEPLKSIIECNLAGDTVMDWIRNDREIIVNVNRNL